MKKTLELKSFKKIAIIQTAFLGDVALALYMTALIKKVNPDCQLYFVTTPAGASLVSCAKTVDTVLTFDKRGLHSGWKGIRFIADILKSKNIDLIIAPHRSYRTGLITFLSKAKFTVGFDRNGLSYLYTKRVEYLSGIHEIERNASLLKVFKDCTELNNSVELELEIPDDDRDYIDNLISRNNLNKKGLMISIAPGSIWETKRWLPEYFEELIPALIKVGYEPVLIGSQDDLVLCKKIEANSGSSSIVGMTSIPQLIYFLSLCKLTITNDSAPTHFSGLAKCPALTIFGATIPEFGFSPLGIYDKSAEIKGLKCRPCGIHGGKSCPVKTFDCMKNLKPGTVLNLALEILNSSNR